jgi:hypothetical protein
MESSSFYLFSSGQGIQEGCGDARAFAALCATAAITGIVPSSNLTIKRIPYQPRTDFWH